MPLLMPDIFQNIRFVVLHVQRLCIDRLLKARMFLVFIAAEWIVCSVACNFNLCFNILRY